MVGTRGHSVPFLFLIETGMKDYLQMFRSNETPLRLVAKVFLLLFFVVAFYLVFLKISNKMETQEKPAPLTTNTTVIDTSPTLSPSRSTYPSQILDLSNWKITLPIGPSENPTEIKQPQLSTYSVDPWFIAMPEGRGVRFRAPVNAVTTGRSDYPRSELREMINNGTAKVSWSTSAGTHTMFLDQAITAVPKKKKHVVVGQIHDADNDIIVIRLEYPNLYVNVNGKNKRKLDSKYMLGKRFTVKFVVSNGKTEVYYNNSTAPVYTLNKKYSDAYFKAGAYTQSNCSREGFLLCNDNNYGEVVIYQVVVTHQ